MCNKEVAREEMQVVSIQFGGTSFLSPLTVFSSSASVINMWHGGSVEHCRSLPDTPRSWWKVELKYILSLAGLHTF